MLSLVPSAMVLGMAALAALWLVVQRPSPVTSAAERRAAARALGLAVVIQSIHFAEEAVTGFPERLGPVLGVPEMPWSFFLVFNLSWLGLWVAAVPGLRSGRTAAFFAAWFLAIAGMFNGIAHPLLAVATNGYFPGLLTSPAIAAAGVWLWTRLREATRSVSATSPAS